MAATMRESTQAVRAVFKRTLARVTAPKLRLRRTPVQADQASETGQAPRSRMKGPATGVPRSQVRVGARLPVTGGQDTHTHTLQPTLYCNTWHSYDTHDPIDMLQLKHTMYNLHCDTTHGP